MQLTRFDRWLRERFVHETHIRTLRAPEVIPKGVHAEQLPEVPGKRFRFLFVIRGSREADQFIASLREANLMFATTVVDRQGRFARWLTAPNRSVSWLIAWLIVGGISAFFGITFLYRLFTNPEVQTMLRDSLETLRH